MNLLIIEINLHILLGRVKPSLDSNVESSAAAAPW